MEIDKRSSYEIEDFVISLERELQQKQSDHYIVAQEYNEQKRKILELKQVVGKLDMVRHELKMKMDTSRENIKRVESEIRINTKTMWQKRKSGE